ncbi:magnesium transporter [Bacillus mesophilus]|uniref:Magnesium transporter MgtE n=1 Tax=Bacillus mesophilus TaxID=1808955 RepID=A0A6M0Q3Z4_9BACI|nr:magnesium transporter [Bacillus mesophilus]NEY70489.1 magnesium transporter [Bacillus mesophilus]
MKKLQEENKEALSFLLDELQPYDFAYLYKTLPNKERNLFLLSLNINQIADLIEELEERELQLDTISKLGFEKKGMVLDEMDNDDLAALLEALPPELVEDLLIGMKSEESEAVQQLMSYPPETAGRLMTNRFVWISENHTVRQTVDKIKIFAEYSETINYIYVIDSSKKLIGVVSYRDIILADINAQITDIMHERVISVPVNMDQEQVANIFERYDFLAMPVVDDNFVLRGIITFDDIIDVVIQEANEDIEKLSASGKSIDFDTKAMVAAYRRLPWLILLLFIGIISGSIISGFEDTLEKVVALAFFMPMIAGMTGNTGTQSLAVVVRGLASREIDKVVVRKVILREFGVGLLIGLICSVLISIIAYVWQDGDMVLSLVVGSSLFLTLVIGTLTGTIIPLILYRYKIDPAIASGPLITTINDIFSLVTYFGLATLFIRYLL